MPGARKLLHRLCWVVVLPALSATSAPSPPSQPSAPAVPCSEGCADKQPSSGWGNPTCALQLANGECPRRVSFADGYCEATC
eukprot:scaffold91644_cov54-Phaeocystis_antarctica.AAC.4